MSGVLFYVVTVSFLIGVALRSFLDIGLAGISAVVVGVVGVGMVSRKNAGGIFAPYLLMSCVAVFCLALGMLRFDLAVGTGVPTALESSIDTEVALLGVVVREPDLRARTQHLYTETDEGMVLVITDRFGDFAYGDEIQFTGTLTRPEAFTTDLGRTFDYAGYLEAQGVTYMMRFAKIVVINHDRGNPLLARILAFKHAFMTEIEGLIPEPAVGLAEGLLLGVKRALGEELTEVFRRTGIIHIVVLSGYNVMLVVAFVTYILSYFLPPRSRLIFSVGAIVAFAVMVGLSATVVRASIMAILLSIANATGRTYEVLRALFAAAVIMVVLNPYLLLNDPGFQLSFLATLGLVVGVSHLESKLRFVPSLIGIRGFLAATVVTQLFVLPLLLYQIGEFSVVSVLVNVLVLPMVPVAMLLTFVTGMVSFVSTTIALPLAGLTTLSLQYILVIAEWFAKQPYAAFAVPAFSFWWVVLAYSAMGGLVWWMYKRQRGHSEVTAPSLDTSNATTDTSVRGWTIVEETEKADDSK